MRASSLLLNRADVPEGSTPGLAALLRGGFAVPLGPGLMGGGSLAERSLARIEAQLLRRLPLPCVCLAASDGDALVNLALQLGAADAAGGSGAGPNGAVCLGAGFRHEPAASRGLLELSLYRRLDAVLVGRERELLFDPAEVLLDALAQWGLDDLQRHEQPGPDGGQELSWSTPAPDAEQGGAPIELLRRLSRPVQGDVCALLVSMDLHALLAALSERRCDARGLSWPAGLAPFDVALLSLVPGGRDTLEKLLPELRAAGLEVLLDDRPGPAPAARAELLAWGLPALVMAGPRSGAGAHAGSQSGGELLLELRHGEAPLRVAVADVVRQLNAGLGRSSASSSGSSSGSRTRRRALLW
ncbi:MAG: hypothetical protein DRQ55_16010 [Planctomycetota bacterium]|nr:MAG: hypothetical protein DRQ55_16010 [Planctomycetota bacterium]